MDTLKLLVSQRTFNELQKGLKTIVREIRPGNADKYCDIKPDGDLIGAKHYHAIEAITSNRESLTIEVLGSEIRLITDDGDNPIIYTHEGKEYLSAEIAYSLGRIL